MVTQDDCRHDRDGDSSSTGKLEPVLTRWEQTGRIIERMLYGFLFFIFAQHGTLFFIPVYLREGYQL